MERPYPVRWRATLALAVALVAGCAGGGSNPPPAAGTSLPPAMSAPPLTTGPTTTGPTTTGPATGGPATGGPSTTSPPRPTEPGNPASHDLGTGSPPPADEGFAWVPWGPADPGDPPPYQWYGLLERHDCEGLQGAVGDEPGRELWRALAAVCAAAVDGDRNQWAVANEAAATATEAGGSTPCLEEAALALLRRALAWHERHPDGSPAIRFPAANSGTACPFHIEQVRAVDDSGAPLGGPLAGPVAGGTLLALSGAGLDEPTRASVGGEPADLVPEVYVENSVVIRTPPARRPGTATIRLTNRAGDVLAPQRFRYVAAPGGTPATETPAPETPAPETPAPETPAPETPERSTEPG